jgi:hypothetical protein
MRSAITSVSVTSACTNWAGELGSRPHWPARLFDLPGSPATVGRSPVGSTCAAARRPADDLVRRRGGQRRRLRGRDRCARHGLGGGRRPAVRHARRPTGGPRLVQAGYRPSDIVAGRLAALLGIGTVLALLFGVVMTIGSRPRSATDVFRALPLTAVVSTPTGWLTAALVPRELEGTLLLIGLVGIQVSIPTGAPDWALPYWAPRRLTDYERPPIGLPWPILHACLVGGPDPGRCNRAVTAAGAGPRRRGAQHRDRAVTATDPPPATEPHLRTDVYAVAAGSTVCCIRSPHGARAERQERALDQGHGALALELCRRRSRLAAPEPGVRARRRAGRALPRRPRRCRGPRGAGPVPSDQPDRAAPGGPALPVAAHRQGRAGTTAAGPVGPAPARARPVWTDRTR